MKLILELGSGMKPYQEEGAEVIHLDRLELPHVEVVHDLNSGILPFGDSEFEKVVAHDIIEHVVHVLPIMEEIWRVLKHDGVVDIHTSHLENKESFRDPTHFHFFTMESFDIFDEGTEYGRDYGFYTTAKFRIIKKWLDDGNWLCVQMMKVGA